jgi:hypothetical protein
LDAGGEKTVIETFLAQWLPQHATSIEAQFVYKAWLDAGGEKAVIETFLAQWLSKHATSPEAQFVYKAWLDAGGEKAVIETFLAQWLSKHATSPEAQFVYKAWLDAGGKKAVIETFLAQWLSKHATSPEAQFVYKAWLDAGGEKTVIQNHILEWIAENEISSVAQFVYKAWLNSNGDLSLISTSLTRWLEHNQEDPEIDYICRAWLKAGGNFVVVQEIALSWLHKNWQEEEAVYLMKSLLRQQDLPLDTLVDILKWCQKFPHNPDALDRFTGLQKRLFNDELAEDVCSTAEAVLTPLVAKKYIDNSTKAKIYQAFSFIISARSLHDSEFNDRVDNIFMQWLHNPVSFGESIVHPLSQRKAYLKRVSVLIYRHKLDVQEDREVIIRFLSWVNLWEPVNKEAIRRDLDDLKSKFPDPELWNIIQFT